VRILHLLRHAKSSWADPTLADPDRPLAPRGERNARQLAGYLGRSGIRPDLVLCSPAMRARQTLDAIAASLPTRTPVWVEDVLYPATGDILWQRVRRLPEPLGRVLLIGHNPAIHDLAVRLAVNGDDHTIARLRGKLPTCALVTLVWPDRSWARLRPTEAVLHDLVAPRDLPR